MLCSQSGFTPLHIAAHYGNINVATLLLNRGAAVDFKARNDITPLRTTLFVFTGRSDLLSTVCGARSGHEQVVEMLLDRGAPYCQRPRATTSTALQLLLHHEVPVTYVTNDYLTALGYVAVTVEPLSQGGKKSSGQEGQPQRKGTGQVTEKQSIMIMDHQTPLHISAALQQDIVHQLLSNGAAQMPQNPAPIHTSHLAARGHRDVAAALLTKELVWKGFTLHAMAKYGRSSNLLLQKNARLMLLRTLHTAHIAAKKNQMEITTTLLEYGAHQHNGYTLSIRLYSRDTRHINNLLIMEHLPP
ncbi:ankyrin-3-like protein [Lates japonicus]|uniref:Ankyrin-3-like protein n=1 Tax=Lates japonicus TaxID=270547 RepID=A0AAD3NGQ0_LATJO|nr:ankyrin-3-like protein [Lates japonicus]